MNARWKQALAAIGMAALLSDAALAEDILLAIYPEAWASALTNFAAFKRRLGYTVHTATAEAVTGGAPGNYESVRAFLSAFRSVHPDVKVYALLVGDWSVIPAPFFRVTPGDAGYSSDLYYRDLHTEFDADGDGVFAEYGPGATNDFDAATLDAVMPTIGNDVHVGRLPLPGGWTPAEVEAVLDRSMAFEREISPRKRKSLMTAGRIDTSFFPADSWDYALKDLVAAVRGDYPDMDVVTVVHVATNYTSAGIDHYVEGGNLSVDYARGQDLVRTLWENDDACSFLCNVSHGGPGSDFALTRGGPGFPAGVSPAVILSMSCSSYLLGQAALTSGVAAAYLGSTAVVTPDVLTIFAGHDMVSALVQQSASLKIFCRGETLGRAFGEEFDYYTRHIVLEGYNAYVNDRAGMLRNVVGFQLIGDPTMRHAHPDHDGDGVSNDDELLAGTDPMSRQDYPRLWGDIGRLACASHTGRTYGIEVSASVPTPVWSAVGTAAPGTGSNLVFDIPLSEEPAAYYRLRITKP